MPAPSIERTVEVSQAKIGYVIGRRGSRIQMIQSRTGCEVDVVAVGKDARALGGVAEDASEEAEGGADIPPETIRRVLVRGIDQEEVDSCCAMIEEVRLQWRGGVLLVAPGLDVVCRVRRTPLHPSSCPSPWLTLVIVSPVS